MQASDSQNLAHERTLLALAILLGLVAAWIGRDAMISDGISYLDLGDAYAYGNWAVAANAYWSPMYACFLGIAIRLLHPSIVWEFPVVHLVNFCCYVASLFAFRYLVRSLLADRRDPQSDSDADGIFLLPEWAVWLLAYALFLWATLELITISFVSPDLLLLAWVCLLAALLVRLRGENSYASFLAFGLVLGAAYLTKSVMFPLGFVFLAVLLFSRKLSRPRVLGTLLAGIAFLVVCSPLVFLISRAKGRLTFGETGKIGYAWLVTPGAPEIHWQGGPGNEVPLHPTRKILDHPPIYEFAQPVAGTYPPWDDPSYWNDGLRPHFNLRSQVRVLVASTVAYWKVLASQLAFVAGILILLLIGGRPARKRVLDYWPVFAISLAALGLYSLVLVLPRYAAPFLLPPCLAAVAAVSLPKREGFDRVAKYVAIAVAVSMAVGILQPLLEEGSRNLLGGLHSRSPVEQIRAAQGLKKMGLKPGDRVAVIGEGINDFWARLTRTKIVAQIMPDERGGEEFWNSSLEQKERVYSILGNTGARALVTWSASHADLGPGWIQVPGTFYRVHFLQSQ